MVKRENADLMLRFEKGVQNDLGAIISLFLRLRGTLELDENPNKQKNLFIVIYRIIYFRRPLHAVVLPLVLESLRNDLSKYRWLKRISPIWYQLAPEPYSTSFSISYTGNAISLFEISLTLKQEVNSKQNYALINEN